MENILLLIFFFFWWIKCLRFSDRFTIYLVRSASVFVCVCVCVCVRERETVAGVWMNDRTTEFVRVCRHSSRRYDTSRRRLLSVNRLIRRPPVHRLVFYQTRTCLRICLRRRGSPKSSQRCRKRKKRVKKKKKKKKKKGFLGRRWFTTRL